MNRRGGLVEERLTPEREVIGPKPERVISKTL